MEEYISIAVREYKYLLNRDDKLAALESGGVDNWSGYDDAMQELYQDTEE
jgi:hypothetical protein